MLKPRTMQPFALHYGRTIVICVVEFLFIHVLYVRPTHPRVDWISDEFVACKLTRPILSLARVPEVRRVHAFAEQSIINAREIVVAIPGKVCFQRVA